MCPSIHFTLLHHLSVYPLGSFVYPVIHFRSPHLSFHPSTPRLGHLSLRPSISRCLTSICPVYPSIHSLHDSFICHPSHPFDVASQPFVCLTMHPLTSRLIHLTGHPSTHFTTHSFVWPSIHFTSPHTHLSGHPSIHFICLAIHPLTSRLIHLSGHPYISRRLTSICLPIHSFHDSFICLALHPFHVASHPFVWPSTHFTTHSFVWPSIHSLHDSFICLAIHPFIGVFLVHCIVLVV